MSEKIHSKEENNKKEEQTPKNSNHKFVKIVAEHCVLHKGKIMSEKIHSKEENHKKKNNHQKIATINS